MAWVKLKPQTLLKKEFDAQSIYTLIKDWLCLFYQVQRSLVNLKRNINGNRGVWDTWETHHS